MIDIANTLAFSVFENRGVYALLLGSGTSRGAQIPTGWEITLDLVRRIALLEGITDKQDWAAWHFSRFNCEPNYSQLLDRISSSPDERRKILHSYIEPTEDDLEAGRKTPTAAHRAIAKLVRDGFIRVIMTTNFDRLLENALHEIGVEPTVISSDDDIRGAVPLVHARCYIIKLHGDYLDTRIRNVESELIKYSRAANRLLDRVLDEFGLIICGWSGDWDSALRAAIKRTPTRRYPFFWASTKPLSQLGDDLLKHRGGRVIQIKDADTFFVDLQKKIEVQNSILRPNPMSSELLVASTKNYISKADQQVALDEIFGVQLRLLSEGRSDASLGGYGQWSAQDFERRISRYEALSEPLARMLGVAGRWGNGRDTDIAAEIIRDTIRVSDEGGLVSWLNIRTYPAVLMFYAYGIGLLRARRLKNLLEWYAHHVRVSDHASRIAAGQLLSGKWVGDSRELWRSWPGYQNRKTPFSDHLHDLFALWTADYIFARSEYTYTFELFEVLGGIAFGCIEASKTELSETLVARNGLGFEWAPIGRTSWHSSIREQILSDLKKDELLKPLLAAGFAAGDQAFLELSIENLRRVMRRLDW